MAGFSIKFKTDTPQALRRASKRASNMRPVWRRVARLLAAAIDTNFRVGGRPKWRRRKRPAKHPILVKTGTLQGSIRAKPFISGVDVGTSVVYAATHQFGRGPIPARPFLTVPQPDEDRIVGMLESWITGPLR